MKAPSWDILICSIPHRDHLAVQLLAELDRQMRPGVGVICYRDNLQVPYGSKIAAMLNVSRADYVSCVDDDDMVAPGFIERVTRALEGWPDYVGYPIRWTVNGNLGPRPIIHSLRYRVWETRDDMIVRDISEKNPMRRRIAMKGVWEGGFSAEYRWAVSVRETGLCREEVFIDEPMYYYQYRSDDHFLVDRAPLQNFAPLPVYPWLTQIGMP